MNTNSRRWDLLAYGDPCADVVVAVDDAPCFGEKVLGRSLGTFSGGTTANAACAFSRLGGRAAVYGRVGGDAHATLLRQSLHHFGVETNYLHNERSSASASVIVMVPQSGERAIVYMPMAPNQVNARDLAAALHQTRVCYAMPYDLGEFITVSRIARECGAQVAIDLEAAVAPDREAMMQRIAHADIAFFNESGFEAGTGRRPTESALTELLAASSLHTVVVTLGAAGAMAASCEGFAQHAAFAQQTVVDTTGAGDTFNAAFLFAALEGQGLQARLRFACAAAGHAVTAMGARGRLPDRMAVERAIRNELNRPVAELAC